MATARIYPPAPAKRGEIITLKAIISHAMETGYRRDTNGKVIPRDLIRSITCHYDGEDIFHAELFPAVSAYPFIAFTTVATKSGPVTITWEGDNGFRQSASVDLVVTD